MSGFELRDPIHHRISFNEFERTIIDHPFFQRLRFISQLGFLHSYVYPGGVHNRFLHSIGTMNVAGRLFDNLFSVSQWSHNGSPKLSNEEIESLRSCVRVAGLLHDIGHGPFSHATELIFPQLCDFPFDWSWWKQKPDRKAVHEDYSVLLIQTLVREGILESSFAQDVASIIHKDILPSGFLNLFTERIPGLRRVLKGLISGEVDADRMDYLLRDSYFCGVAYGNFDIDWLISSLGIAEKDGEMIITLSENGVRAYEDMLLARYHMIDQVYYHKTKAGFAHYLEEAICTNEIPLLIPADPYLYTQLRDGEVIEQIFKASENPKNYWSEHIVKRIPAKRILRLQKSKEEDQILLSRLTEFCKQNQIRYFTHSVSNELSHFGEGVSDRATMIYVAKRLVNGVEYIPIFKYSDLLQKYNEKLNFTDFFVLREDAEKFDSLKKGF
ncbi:HD domain-containing protein [Candidatus Uhrbacteria bacterium]|nr:HD domain-containing protein [Candidatus Uhrbacteria bacterium]